MKHIAPIVFMILLSLFSIMPFFHAGFFSFHDNVQVQRVYEMAQSLHDGMFPVRWVNDLGYGYGYPIFNFYAPLTYYVGATFLFFGFSALLATKIMFCIGIILAGIGMYMLGKYLWGSYAGITAGVFYVYATYHAVDIFVRGDVSEVWAYGLLPFAMLGVLGLAKEKKWQYLFLGALSYAGIILSHNLTAMMVTPFLLGLLCLTAYLYKNGWGVLCILFGISLAGFYWLPAIMETSYTNVLSQIGGAADFHNNFVCPLQFWYSPWGYGGSVPGCIDGLSFMVGKLHIIVTLVTLLLSCLPLKRDKLSTILTLLLFFCFLFSLFIQTQYSIFIWNNIKTMAFFQYPWRFLIVTSFFSSLLAGNFLYILMKISFFKKKIVQISVTMILVVGIVVLQNKFFIPQRFDNYQSSYYTNTSMIKFSTSRVSDEYMPKDFTKPKNITQVPTKLVQNVPVSLLFNKTQEKILISHAALPLQMNINLAYFPAWKAFIDGKEVLSRSMTTGISVFVPSGNHTITLLYQQTPSEVGGDIISISGILLFILAIIVLKRTTFV